MAAGQPARSLIDDSWKPRVAVLSVQRRLVSGGAHLAQTRAGFIP